MKLSDAIALGRVLIETPSAFNYSCCAIGMAAAAMAGEQVSHGYSDQARWSVFKTPEQLCDWGCFR
jgi:hypothetical protein